MTMTKQKAIRSFCLDCCGGSTKDTALCTAPSCPLFEHRLGFGLKTTRAVAYMKSIAERYPGDVADLSAKYDLDPALYFGHSISRTSIQRQKRANGRLADKRHAGTKSAEIHA